MINNICLPIITSAIIVVVVFISSTMIQLKKESKTMLTALTTMTAPKVPPVVYLPYKECMLLLDDHIRYQFQRIYTEKIMPKMNNGTIKKLAPSDALYLDFLKEIVLNILTTMPEYLFKSVKYYYGITDINISNDTNVQMLTKNITNKASGLLNHHLVMIAEMVQRGKLEGEPVLNSILNYGDTILGTSVDKISSPDGSQIKVVG